MTGFGNNLRAERARRGMTQQELADASGMSKKSIALYEKGKTLPRLDKAQSIAEVLGVSLEALYDWGGHER